VTPVSTSTSVTTTGSIETPGPQSTPTLVNIVHASTFPQPGAHESPVSHSERELPATGQGAGTPGAIMAGLLGTIVAAIGLGLCATGLRTRGTK
jgi:hypothetical protein